MYDKLSGMTGTADTEAYEFQEIYGLETVIIPTNKPHDPQATRTTGSSRPRAKSTMRSWPISATATNAGNPFW